MSATNSLNQIQEKADADAQSWVWATPLIKEYIDLERQLSEKVGNMKEFLNEFKAAAISPALMRTQLLIVFVFFRHPKKLCACVTEFSETLASAV